MSPPESNYEPRRKDRGVARRAPAVPTSDGMENAKRKNPVVVRRYFALAGHTQTHTPEQCLAGKNETIREEKRKPEEKPGKCGGEITSSTFFFPPPSPNEPIPESRFSWRCQGATPRCGNFLRVRGATCSPCLISFPFSLSSSFERENTSFINSLPFLKKRNKRKAEKSLPPLEEKRRTRSREANPWVSTLRTIISVLSRSIWLARLCCWGRADAIARHALR